jgi:rhodanese-related sulfurtransferase
MSVKLATPREAKQILDENSAALVVDVRTEREFAAGHPEGSINVPAFVATPVGGLQQNPEFLKVMEHVVERDQPILFSCQSGRRSMVAAQLLERAGYADLTNVIGGFAGGQDPRSGESVVGWRDAKLPVETEVKPEAAYSAQRRKAGLQ